MIFNDKWKFASHVHEFCDLWLIILGHSGVKELISSFVIHIDKETAGQSGVNHELYIASWTKDR